MHEETYMRMFIEAFIVLTKKLQIIKMYIKK